MDDHLSQHGLCACVSYNLNSKGWSGIGKWVGSGHVHHQNNCIFTDIGITIVAL